jgi:hypothetical protein
MTQPTPQVSQTPNPPRYSLLAGFLSYLIPGLGQIVQGRFAKGVLFFVCLYGLFFTGMAMGDWKNVYLADPPNVPVIEVKLFQLPNGGHVIHIGPFHLPKPVAVVWNRLHFAGQFWIGVAAWPALWQYNHLPVPSEDTSPFLHNFQREPTSEEESSINTEKGKVPDVAWVYTVIAGVLNILVIYDAVAGPAFRGVSAKTTEEETQPAAATARKEAAVV